jgi:exosortase D (VPLPA-CTERM-specific)
MADGFLHFFEGWIIFIGCLAFLFGEMWLMNRFGKKTASISGVLFLPSGTEYQSDEPLYHARPIPLAFLTSVGLVISALIIVHVVDQRAEVIPVRETFINFPKHIGEWQGEEENLLPQITDLLALTDYLLIDYFNDSNESINFYAAYYQSQRKGVGPHSPRVCIPGGGWSITEINRIRFDLANEGSLPVNRVIMRKGAQQQLVYYWFKQQGRDIANEYLMKGYLLIDSLTRNRSDGSLIRFMTPIDEGEDLNAVDARLQRFIALVNPKLTDFIPG